MDESTVRRAAIVAILVTFAFIPMVFYFMVMSFFEEAYPEAAFLVGVSFVLISQLVYYYERAFTPAEIWRTRDGFMVRLIGQKPPKETARSSEPAENDGDGVTE